MDIREIRRRRLQQLILARFGGVMARLAEKIGRQSSYVARILSDNSEHSRNIGEKLAREIELACDLPDGYLDMPFDFKHPLINGPGMGGAVPASVIGSNRHEASTHDAEPTERYNATIQIPRMELGINLGEQDGLPEPDRMLSSIGVNVVWLRQNLAITDPANLKLIMASGTSMMPSIAHGDALIVDTGVTVILQDGIYLFSLAGQLLLKRLQRGFDGLRILSDNSVYREVMVPPGREDEIVVHAKVVYCLTGGPI